MSKLTDLDSALKTLLKPGMALHLTTQSRAATRAVQRVFAGQDMDLTLIMGRVGGGHGADLVASGLVKRVIAGSYGAMSRGYTGPLKQVQKAHASGAVSFQHWSFMSLTQRLMAAAQGVPFLPTHSLRGTTMAIDNAPEYATVPDPTGRQEDVGVVAALHPDVSVVHVLACDEEGNAIMVPPLEDGAWGPKAARVGAIVTTENIVSRATIRKLAHLVRLPSRYVSAVCHVPYGAHPGPFGSAIVPEFGSYAEDEDFNVDYFAAMRDPEQLEAWLARWVYGHTTHQSYLDALGGARLTALRDHAAAERAIPEAPTAPPQRAVPADQLACSDNEVLMALAMREVLARVASTGYDLLLVGIGLSEVPGSGAWTFLREQGKDVKLVMGHGYYGFPPFPGRSEPDAGQTMMIGDAFDIYGVLTGGRIGRGLAILGTAQVDQMGNVGSTLIGGKLLTGSGGSNDAASTCDTLIVTGLSKRKLVKAVDYITSPGTRLRAVCTEKGVFERDAVTGRLVLTRLMTEAGKSRAELLAHIAANIGWELEVSPDLIEAPRPTAEELAVIRWLMPSRYQE